MQTLIIGRRGFLSKFLFKKDLENFIFIDHNEICGLSEKFKKSINKIIITSFNPKWKIQAGYNSAIEKRILKNFDTKKLLIQYLSTSKVYPNRLNLCEKSIVQPNSIYANNKIIGEKFLANNFENYHIFRISNMFASHGGAKGTFLHTMLNNIKKNIIDFDVCKDSIRDFVPISFVAEILNSNCYDVENGIYNLSSNVTLTIKELIDVIIDSNKINKNKLKYTFGNNKVSQTLDNSKIVSAFKVNKLSKRNILDFIGDIDAK